jgi:glycosyltransferase involved in cell wall biosynthesis
VATFAAQLERALDDESLRGLLRGRGLARAATFTWARTADATVAAYRVAIGAGAAT